MDFKSNRHSDGIVGVLRGEADAIVALARVSPGRAFSNARPDPQPQANVNGYLWVVMSDPFKPVKPFSSMVVLPPSRLI
jgi:hypothetical protein